MIAIDHDVHSLKSQAEYKKRGMDEPCSKISISLRGFVMQPASDEMRPKAGKAGKRERRNYELTSR